MPPGTYNREKVTNRLRVAFLCRLTRPDRLRLLRVERRWRQEDVADAVGCSAAEVGRWEAEHTHLRPNEENAAALARVFNVPQNLFR